jgi:hypothetical protein
LQGVAHAPRRALAGRMSVRVSFPDAAAGAPLRGRRPFSPVGIWGEQPPRYPPIQSGSSRPVTPYPLLSHQGQGVPPTLPRIRAPFPVDIRREHVPGGHCSKGGSPPSCTERHPLPPCQFFPGRGPLLPQHEGGLPSFVPAPGRVLRVEPPSEEGGSPSVP